MKTRLLLSAGLFFAAFLSAFSQVITPSSNIIYVKKDAAGSGSGASWNDAVPELADALQWARENLSGGTWNSGNPLQIWVAKGTYKPLYSSDDDAGSNSPPVLNSFVLAKDVQVYGGFEGNEATLAARANWKANPSILSGELDEPYEEGNRWDDEVDVYTSVCHVVVAAGEMGSAVLDGFTVTGGKAEYWAGHDVNGNYISTSSGGGIYVQDSYPTLRNLVVANNSANYTGGGIFIESGIVNETVLKLSNISVMGNSADMFGGGIYLKGKYPQRLKLATHNCVLMGNVADRGGAFYLDYSRLSLVNTVIAGNNGELSGSPYGGGLYLYNTSELEIINTTISANKGASIYRESGTITAVKNSIINNPGVYTSYLAEDKVTNSIVQSVTTSGGSGGTNLAGTTNPQFVNGRTAADAPFTNGDYRLKTNSPVLNKGADAHYPGDLVNDTDPSGKPRRSGSSIDMGAYEGGYDPLPVTMTSFEARSEGNIAQLSWETVLEVNASHFELQRSVDGRIFDAIGMVPAKGEGAKTVRYQFSDHRPALPGVLSYYRIKTVDKDGTYELSAIVSVKWGQAENIFGYVYPNPTRGGKVMLDLRTTGNKTDITVSDMSGRIMKVPVTEKVPGNFELETDGLSAGLYVVKARIGGTVVAESRLLVE